MEGIGLCRTETQFHLFATAETETPVFVVLAQAEILRPLEAERRRHDVPYPMQGDAALIIESLEPANEIDHLSLLGQAQRHDAGLGPLAG